MARITSEPSGSRVRPACTPFAVRLIILMPRVILVTAVLIVTEQLVTQGSTGEQQKYRNMSLMAETPLNVDPYFQS